MYLQKLVKNTNLVNFRNIRYLHSFSDKHTGNSKTDVREMLEKVKSNSIQDLISEIVPNNIIADKIKYFPELSEQNAIKNMTKIIDKNIIKKNLIGLDFNDTILPPILQRKILENPKWYTSYTPYQSEISQGRLEAQFNFQTLITELTGMDVSNISLLDSGSAATEALNMSYTISKGKRKTFFCCDTIHPVILDILSTRAKTLDITLIIDDPKNIIITDDLFGFMFSYTDRYGTINNDLELHNKLKENNTIISCHANLMSLLLLKSPMELGANISFGTAQNFGIPLWCGGPHPAFFATSKEYIRLVPGRIIGKSIDSENKECYRISLQTREQHIKKEKATSNICTSQSLLSVVASMYAIYHGKENLVNISKQINDNTNILLKYLLDNNVKVKSSTVFDTITIYVNNSKEIMQNLSENGYSSLINEDQSISLSLNEDIGIEDIVKISNVIVSDKIVSKDNYMFNVPQNNNLPESYLRDDNFLPQDIFNLITTETDILRYIQRLENKDYTLTEGMVPLGSCTMKLNAVSELIPLSFEKIQKIHPYSCLSNKVGYSKMISELSEILTNLIGLEYISYQSNSGAMGEYSGLLCIKKYHDSNNNNHRNLCLIPESAHGTNFASAKLAGFTIKKYNDSISLTEFEQIIDQNKDTLGCIMITYPNTYGIFDNNIKEICNLVHDNGGLVYMDGANMNAQVGITNPGECGADVCHLNLHKTFCIPHGGGGPGMGPILVNNKLKDYLPHNVITNLNSSSYGSLSLSENSSASILSITYQYLKMMGSEKLLEATQIAMLNANYLKDSLQDDYTIFKVNENGRVGHEFIINFDEFKDVNIKDVDIAKRLIDYSFHPPTMSWPVPNSIMIEPTESESKSELDRFITAMKSIRIEIEELRNGEYCDKNNVLKNSPHSINCLKTWNRPYTIEKACFPVDYLNDNKFWPSVSRVNDLYGDKNLIVK